METGQPSRTALGAATHRALHQVLEQGAIFADPLAGKILGGIVDLDEAARKAEENPHARRLRLFLALRSRFAEDELARAVAGGVRQLVLLGAGLDTYAYRTALGDRLRIFEVDHPSTQAWKRRRLEEADLPIPDFLTFAPVDFEQQSLAEGLERAGFDPAQQTFFTWLGVVPYLTEAAVFATLGYIASLPGGAHVVFDYANPPETEAEGDERDELAIALAKRVAAVGESFHSYFVTAPFHERMRTMGFCKIDDLGPVRIRERFFPGRGLPIADRGGHIVHAATVSESRANR